MTVYFGPKDYVDHPITNGRFHEELTTRGREFVKSQLQKYEPRRDLESLMRIYEAKVQYEETFCVECGISKVDYEFFYFHVIKDFFKSVCNLHLLKKSEQALKDLVWI